MWLGSEILAPSSTHCFVGGLVVKLIVLQEDGRDIQRWPVALIMEPTRELAMQVHKHLTKAARYTGIQVCRQESDDYVVYIYIYT